MAPTYVIGHVNPDTDSIASAIGYAWLLRERDGEDVIAARAGAINPQTTWVLKRLGLEPPILLTDASPRFSTITRRLDTAAPENPSARCLVDPESHRWGCSHRPSGRWHAGGVDHRA